MDVQQVLARLRRNNFMHPKFSEAYSRVEAHAVFGQPGMVIMLLGATRVGKTTLSKLLEGKLTREQVADQVGVPLIRVEAATTDQGFISSRYLCLMMLQALRHPFYDGEGYKPRWSDSETTLRAHLDKALRSRCTKYIFIDEAHHLLRNKNHRNVGAVLDTLKCLANEAGVILVLFGGYELLKTCFDSAHLNGRSTIIDFQNYRIDGDDIAIYDRILSSIDPILPWQKGHSLLRHRELIYAGTLGCYGMLVHWISSAMAEMKACGSRALTDRHFIRTKLHEQLIPISEDIDLGTQLMHELDSSSSGPCCGTKMERVPSSVRTKRKLKPGTRKPGRDQVGR